MGFVVTWTLMQYCDSVSSEGSLLLFLSVCRPSSGSFLSSEPKGWCFLAAAAACARSRLFSRTVRPPPLTASSAPSVRSRSSLCLCSLLDPGMNMSVIFLSGIDSRYNEGCTELAKYLFYGLYGRNSLSVEHVVEEFPEDLLDGEFLLLFFFNVGFPSPTRCCLFSRCHLATQGAVCAFVLQPGQLQLPAAVCVPLEESAPLLHDRGRGTANTSSPLSRSCMSERGREGFIWLV